MSRKKLLKNKNTSGTVSFEKLQKAQGLSLEEKASKASNIHSEEEKVIEEMVSELKVSDYYKKSEKKLRKEAEDEKEAIEVGCCPDKYYTAKGKEDADDELGEFEESRGSLRSGPSR